MRKIGKRLALQRETLQALQSLHLHAVGGALGNGTYDWTYCTECSESCQQCTLNPETLSRCISHCC
jgi:hypothetical protein